MKEILLAVILTAALLVGCITSTQPMPVPTVSVSLPAPSPTATTTPTLAASPTPSPTIQPTPIGPPFGTPKATVVPAGGNAPFGNSFTLALGQTVMMEGSAVTFTFVNVTGDSRCPSGAQCIWAGMVSTQVRMQEGGAQSSVTVSDRQLDGASIQINGKAYVVELMGVTPYPSVNQSINPADYKATFIVTKA